MRGDSDGRLINFFNVHLINNNQNDICCNQLLICCVSRLLSNRVSAQKSRLRRTKYVNELENQAKELEVIIS